MNQLLNQEVDLFEKYVKRLDPKDATKTGESVWRSGAATLSSLATNASTVHVERATGQKKKLKQRTGSSTERCGHDTSDRALVMHRICRMMKLTLEQKCVIAAREIDDLREEMDGKQIEREKQLDHHKVRDGGVAHRPTRALGHDCRIRTRDS